MKAEIRPTNVLITPEAKGVWLATGDAAIFVPYNELLMLGCMLHGAFLDHIRGSFEVAREANRPIVSPVSSAIAAMFLEKAIAEGKRIEIPSLGIVLNEGRKDE